MESLWVKFLKEHEQKEVIEHDHGFIALQIVNQECFLSHLYVDPSFRRHKVAWNLAQQACEYAKERGCKVVSSTIRPSFPGATESMAAHLAFGMRIHSSREDFIIMSKELL